MSGLRQGHGPKDGLRGDCVYDDDRLVCKCPSSADAARIVAMSERIEELERLALGSCDSADIAVGIGQAQAERIERLEAALKALRDGIDVAEAYCLPVPIGSLWRYVIDRAIDGAALAPAPELAKEGK